MFILKKVLYGLWLVLLGLGFVSAESHQPPSLSQESNLSAAAQRETLNLYCVSCHNEVLKTAGLMLDQLDPGDLSKDGHIWEKLLRKLRNQEMPPAGMPRPDESEYNGLITFIENGLDLRAETHPNPGRTTAHRLNRTEYSNVIRDLLALEIDSTELLPADDIGYGFDNMADVLMLSPFLMERYLSASAKISRLAIGDVSIPQSYKTYPLHRSLRQEDRMGEDLPYGSRGGTAIRHYFPVDGEYLIKVRLQTGRFDQILGRDKDRQLDIRLNGLRIERFTIAADERGDLEIHGDGPKADDHLEVIVPVRAGTHEIVATFVRDTVKVEGEPDIFSAVSTRNREPSFFEGVGEISIGGPYSVTGTGNTPSRNSIFICYPSPTQSEEGCVTKIISNLTRRAYRRPVTDDDISVFLGLYEEGKVAGGFEAGIRMALQGILVSPEFLFRMEFDPPNVKPGDSYQIGDLELASRLSFFLWSSIPDEELLTIAERGKLTDPAIMLADPRSRSLVSNFVGQWLYLRNMERVLPDPVAFPNFDENLRHALQTETELLIESMYREDRSVVDLLNSDYTFLNDRLARHYGIDGIYGSEFRQVEITDKRRKGLLGQGSILTVTSYANRTAPTIRGKWILEQILGSHPPPPPPNVPTLEENNNTRELTMRERMEMHRANPACAACHKVMDPIGFALENFDGLGRWRETMAGAAIDSSGVLPDGTSFDGPVGLQDLLLSKEELFVETFIERLLTYALGRGVEYYDLPVVRKIRRDVTNSNYSWSSIISAITKSVPFQMKVASLNENN
jgi:hypothetical protein